MFMNFPVVLNTINMSFFLALITHSMDVLVNFVICEHFTDPRFNTLSIHEHTHQMKTFCERKKNCMSGYL